MPLVLVKAEESDVMERHWDNIMQRWAEWSGTHSMSMTG